MQTKIVVSITVQAPNPLPPTVPPVGRVATWIKGLIAAIAMFFNN